VNILSRDIDQLKSLLTTGRRVLATTHIRPDPDAIGSVLAVSELLESMGCIPSVIIEDTCPPRCRFLPGADKILTVAQCTDYPPFDLALIVDAGDRKRIGAVEKFIAAGAELVNIDHHGSNDKFGKLNFVYPDSAACGELLYFLFGALDIPISPSMAMNLYAGLLTDTGRFRHSNTTPRSLRVAASLIEAGADAPVITDHLYYTIAASDIYSMGSILQTLELHGNGKISTMMVSLDHGIEDPDHAVDYARAIDGVEVAVLFSEMKDGKIRVSMRSKSYVNVSQLAESFGGGGHLRAAGFRMRGTLESVKTRIMPALLKAVNEPAICA
jgi:phosphoesterase RecJ-like protein